MLQQHGIPINMVVMPEAGVKDPALTNLLHPSDGVIIVFALHAFDLIATLRVEMK